MIEARANIQHRMKVEFQLPSFAEASDWLNLERPNATNHDRIEALKRETKGRPTLVHFWSLSSESSITNLSQVSDLRDQRKREGLRVIAVHSPQAEAEKDPGGGDAASSERDQDSQLRRDDD
jgi:hypothetical protein